jgi:Protein of unknown function DUF262
MLESDVEADSEQTSITDRALLDDELEDLEAAEASPTAVTYSTQDYPVDGLVSRLNSGAMLIPQFRGTDTRVATAGFQRGFVWSKAQMDKFIESLLLGYPIPGIFLVKQSGDKRLLVLDGQQRLETLRRFYEGLHDGREFALGNVGEAYKGLTYKSLDDNQQRQLNDSFMQATIVEADGSDEVDEAIYQIFERLNSGGTQLTPHEIRVALYAGELVTSIEKLNNDPNWRHLYGKRSKRIRDHELVTRILAMYADSGSYARPMKQFLNNYAAGNRNVDVTLTAEGELFREAARALDEKVGLSAFRRAGSQLNVAQAEAVMVATMNAAESGMPEDLSDRITALKEDPAFDASTSRATADTDAVSRRLERAHTFIVV